MSFEELFKGIVSAIIAIILMTAFIPVFQELGVDYGFISLFIFAVIISIAFAVIAAIKKLF